jgi:DNA-binding beta-propeller fold protein YncE
VAVDLSGNVYVANETSNSVTKISGGVATTFVSSGLNGPTGIAVASNGDIYVADSGNGQITQVTPGGVTSQFASGFSSPQLMIAAPEPGSAAFLGLGVPALLGLVRRRKSAV